MSVPQVKDHEGKSIGAGDSIMVMNSPGEVLEVLPDGSVSVLLAVTLNIPADETTRILVTDKCQ